MSIEDYVKDVFAGFMSDPASSDFQRGYLAAVLDLYEGAMRGDMSTETIGVLCNQVCRSDGDADI